jgi:hypothetical protein
MRNPRCGFESMKIAQDALRCAAPGQMPRLHRRRVNPAAPALQCAISATREAIDVPIC